MLKPKINKSIKKQIANRKKKKKGNNVFLLYYRQNKQKSFKPWAIFLQKANKAFRNFCQLLYSFPDIFYGILVFNVIVMLLLSILLLT